MVYQDNQSAMLLAKNGRASSSKQTRHMNICYFFVTNRIQAGDIRVEYCPTDDMQGSKFTRFRDQILNVQGEHDITAISAQRSVLGNEAEAHPIQEDRQGVPLRARHAVNDENAEEEAAMHHKVE